MCVLIHIIKDFGKTGGYRALPVCDLPQMPQESPSLLTSTAPTLVPCKSETDLIVQPVGCQGADLNFSVIEKAADSLGGLSYRSWFYFSTQKGE